MSVEGVRRAKAALSSGCKPLCVPNTLSELMTRRNRLSWRNDRAAVFRAGRPGLAIQVEVACEDCKSVEYRWSTGNDYAAWQRHEKVRSGSRRSR
jgi:hypothetical protein